MNKIFLWFRFLQKVKIPHETCYLPVTRTKIHLFFQVLPFSFHSLHPATNTFSEKCSQEAGIKQKGFFLLFTDLYASMTRVPVLVWCCAWETSSPCCWGCWRSRATGWNADCLSAEDSRGEQEPRQGKPASSFFWKVVWEKGVTGKELALSQGLYKPSALPAKAKRSDNVNNYKKKQHDFPVSVIYTLVKQAVRLQM